MQQNFLEKIIGWMRGTSVCDDSMSPISSHASSKLIACMMKLFTEKIEKSYLPKPHYWSCLDYDLVILDTWTTIHLGEQS